MGDGSVKVKSAVKDKGPENENFDTEKSQG
jgi:hypothetical protein